MARIRQQSEIVSSLLDYYRSSIPALDTKVGTVARDLFIDGFAQELSKLYDELQRVSTLQSIRVSVGSDLDRLGSNYGVFRRQATKSTGPSLLTFTSMPSNISISRGSILSSSNGAQFLVQNSIVLSTVNINTYRAIATQNRASLDSVNISDQYATTALVQAATAGDQGNISAFALVSVSIPGISNVTNVSPFSGGFNVEDDTTFRSRILSVFSGSNTGTALGYKNTVLGDPNVIDALVVGPGDPLMIRDGTQTYTNELGVTTITQQGTGGKIDIYVFGTRLQEVLNTYVYRDLSNTGDPTNPANNYVLGQIVGDSGKTVTQKRLDDMQAQTVPSQPATSISQVSGSESGGNFQAATVDSLGRISGNYALLKDTGNYAGSPWGMDALTWTDDRIRNLPEDKTKTAFNGQDPLSFADVTYISAVQQRVYVTNENSTVNPNDRTLIQLSHYPCTSVTRVVNVSTGERYVVTNQNVNGTGTTNTTGVIQISGGSLPSISDILQVDYTWLFNFDNNYDFDNKVYSYNLRDVSDSIDWGYSNDVRREKSTLIYDGYDGYYIDVTHPITTVISVNYVQSPPGVVAVNNQPNNRLNVNLGSGVTVSNVVSINTLDGTDLWNTSKKDGSISGSVIFFPTDCVQVPVGTIVHVYFNAVDIYNQTGAQGSSNLNHITIASRLYPGNTPVEVNYIADVSNLLPPTQLSNLPVIKLNNNFKNAVSSPIPGSNQPFSNIYDGYGGVIQNLRMAPSNIGLSISGSVSAGVLSVRGTTVRGVFDTVITVPATGSTSAEKLVIDLYSSILKATGAASNTTLPNNIKLCRVTSVQKVTTTTSLDILSVDHTYDIKGYHLKDNTFSKNESVQDSSINSYTKFILPQTSGNLSNAPSTGTKLKITYYYDTYSDVENVPFSKSGTLYTNKRFFYVYSVSISSGFTSSPSATATLSMTNFNQPLNGTRYRAYYDYLAPKANERITITYNTNNIIQTSTFSVENSRPINADVLVKEAIPILVDVTMYIVVTSDYSTNPSNVLENVKSTITSALNATQLGSTVDSSDLIADAQGVTGVDRTRVLYYNVHGKSGSVLSISAKNNQYIQANIITINSESR